jgi:1,4-alpha-glucan branching enzyme
LVTARIVRQVTVWPILVALLAGCAGTGLRQPPIGTARDVRFSLEDRAARSVAVAGSFNGWEPNVTPMRKADIGEWSATVKLQPGVHQYMFVIDGKKWLPDPKAELNVPDGFGRTNSLVVIE